MFNLEQSIANWRQQLIAAGLRSPAQLDELENHLRDEIEHQLRSGQNESDAFQFAIQRLGHAGALKSEFARAGETLSERLKQFIPARAGLSNPQLATAMNLSNPNSEPRWSTYLKAGIFILPAAFLWLFSMLFLFPKLQELCHAAGTRVFNFDQAPAGFRGAGIVGDFMVFLTAHGLLAAGVVILAVALLEWRSVYWSQYRRTAIGIGIYLFNFAVLLSITLMVVSAIVAVPNLPHHVK